MIYDLSRRYDFDGSTINNNPLENTIPYEVAQKLRAQGHLWSCDNCDVTATFQKRTGPTGKHTLCNRCGIIWSRFKREYRLSHKLECSICFSTPAIKILENSTDHLCKECFRDRIEKNSHCKTHPDFKMSIKYILNRNVNIHPHL